MPEVEKVTEDEASEALHQLVHGVSDEEDEQVEVTEPEPSGEPVEAAEPGAEEVAVEDAVEVADDDLESLRTRNEELTAGAKEAEEQFNAKVEALQGRNASSEKILRDRLLQKATVVDKARKALEASRSENGIAESEVDQIIQEIRGTLNPGSTNYAPPEPQPVASEDHELILNSFLNEQGMTRKQADEFGTWIQTEAATSMSQREQAVAGDSIDGFLRLAHGRWREGVQEKEKEKRSDAVGAVRSVQRTQRAAAKAASASPTAPKKQTAGTGAGTDEAKLTKDDVSALLRQSVEQYH
jgi:hypothetical protein